MNIREATREDFVKVCGKPPDVTCRAIALTENDNPVAVGGYFMANGQAVAFSDLAKELPKRELIKAARAMLKFLKNVKLDIVATSGPHGVTALQHFGFEPHGDLWRLR